MQSRIEIRIPDNNLIERRYIIDFIFDNMLGIGYDVVIDENVHDYEIVWEDRKLVVRDSFFNEHPVALSYLDIKYLPQVFYAKNQFTVEEDVPVLYGTNEMEVCENAIVCGVDVFASSFFMLTRWEEYVNKKRDEHDRFPGVESIACKNDFLNRPVVNEWAEMLWNMLARLKYQGIRKQREYELILTHDVDNLKSSKLIRTIGGDILKRRNLKLAFQHFSWLFKDPANSYSFLMDVSEKRNVKSHFYFMAVGNHPHPLDHSQYIHKRCFELIIKDIRKRGHLIGFHPGYTTYNDRKIWREQKERLEESLSDAVFEGRQHYLRLKIPETLQIWSENGMKIDSTLGYADREGFRCGTGDCFLVFDFVRRQVLKLIERPLIVMDGTLRVYQNLPLKEAEIRLKYFVIIAKKYQMPVTFLFHNSSFDNLEWKGWRRMYEYVF